MNKKRFFATFAPMKRHLFIGMVLLLALAGCQGPQRDARLMVRRAERLFDTYPDSTVSLIDSVLRMPVYFNDGKRMEIALLQAEALFGDRGQEITPLMDDEFFDDKPFLSTSPELERAADYYARKKKYDKAAHAALYSGFVQQHYGEKTHAMQSFKDAERYGKKAKDSLTVARAKYWMGKILYDDYLYSEAVAMFKSTERGISDHLVEKALVHNMLSVCYLLQNDYETAELCLQKSLLFAEKRHIDKVKRKALNNYAVLYRLQGKYDQSVNCLKQIEADPYLDEKELLIINLNLGNVFFDEAKMDSANFYFERMEALLPTTKAKPETQLAVYDALYQLAKTRHCDSLALQYRDKHEKLLYEIMQQRQDQNMYRIHRQYDHESLQNALNRKIINKHRIILFISILLFVAAIIILVLQLRHKQMREAEAEMKRQIDAMKEDLRRTVKSSVMDEEITLRIKMMLTACRTKKNVKDPKNEWQPLVNQVMNGKENLFEAVRATVEMVYPNLYSVLMEKYPNLTETEAKICLLSFCDISNAEMAELMGLRLNTVNQNRSTLRKKLNLNSDKMKEQLRNVFSYGI